MLLVQRLIELRPFVLHQVVATDASADRAVAVMKADPHGTIVEIDDFFIAHWPHGSEFQ